MPSPQLLLLLAVLNWSGGLGKGLDFTNIEIDQSFWPIKADQPEDCIYQRTTFWPIRRLDFVYMYFELKHNI